MSLPLVGRLAAIFVTLVAGGVLAWVPERSWALGVVAGLGLFLMSALMLIFVGDRMLGTATLHGRKPGAWLVPLLLLAKLVVLGGGSYVALVPLSLPPIALVIGALSTLALVTLAAIVVRRREGRGTAARSPDTV